jgi:hypothetical protein
MSRQVYTIVAQGRDANFKKLSEPVTEMDALDALTNSLTARAWEQATELETLYEDLDE